MRIHITVAMGAAFLLVFASPPAAASDTNAAIETLKDCLERNLDDERQKQKPKAANLLRECRTEHEVLLSTVDPSLTDEMRKLIAKDVENLLKQ